MIENTQSYSKLLLIITRTKRAATWAGSCTSWDDLFPSMFSYKDEGREVAYQNAYTIGTDMTSCLSSRTLRRWRTCGRTRRTR